jgi:hypothetical protein
MVVYGLRHGRARELYVLCLLECRRVMFDTLPPRAPIAPGRLIGTREAWMVHYAHLLSADEFTKFATLTRSLSPFVVVLIDPQSRSRRLDRNPTISRRIYCGSSTGIPTRCRCLRELPGNHSRNAFWHRVKLPGLVLSSQSSLIWLSAVGCGSELQKMGDPAKEAKYCQKIFEPFRGQETSRANKS